MALFGKKKRAVTPQESRRTLHKHLSFTASEQYRLLRTNVMFTLPEEVKCPVIGVTSAVRGEGKSVTSINLAYTLSENGSRVLLIDGDLRLPTIAKKLGIDNAPGLSNVLLGERANVEDWHSPENENWYILPAGVIPPNPSELLGSSRMKKLLDTLSQNFDYIVIDLPPINIVSDAMAIAKNLTGLIVVVRENFTTKKNLEQCVRQIRLSGAKMLGFVLNESGENSGFGRYSYRQKYYYKNQED